MQMQGGASERERGDEHAEAGQFTTGGCTSMGNQASNKGRVGERLPGKHVWGTEVTMIAALAGHRSGVFTSAAPQCSIPVEPQPMPVAACSPCAAKLLSGV